MKEYSQWKKLIINVLLLEVFEEALFNSVVTSLFDKFGSPEELQNASQEDVTKILSPLRSAGLKAFVIRKVSEDWLNGKKIDELYVVGEYGNQFKELEGGV